MKTRIILTLAGLGMSIGLAGFVAQAQQSRGNQYTSMMDMMGMSYDQCLQIMKQAGMSPGMMMRSSMMGVLEVDPYDPAAVLAMKNQLNLTADQQEKLAAIQKDAREKTRALLTEAQQNELKPLFDTPNTMPGMWRQWHSTMSNQSGVRNQSGAAMMMCPWMGR